MATAQILIVEDDLIITAELTRRLKHLGYTVAGTAVSGPDAIQKARMLSPNLVLMDVGLKGAMTGMEAGEVICAQLQIPVVYLTAYAPETLWSDDQAAAPQLYIRKPFEEQALLTTIESSPT